MHESKSEGGSRLLFCLWDAFCAMCMALSFAIDMNLRSWNNYYNWSASMPESLVSGTVMISGYFILRWARRNLTDSGWGMRIFSLFLGAW